MYIVYSRREDITWLYRIKKIHFQSIKYRYLSSLYTSFFHFLQEKEEVIKKIGQNVQRCWFLLGKCLPPSNITFGSRFSWELLAVYEISSPQDFLMFLILKMMQLMEKPAEPAWGLLWGVRKMAFPDSRGEVGVKIIIIKTITVMKGLLFQTEMFYY